MFFFFKQKTAYEMRISDWSSDVCSSDLRYALKIQRRVIAAQIIGRGTGHAHRHPHLSIKLFQLDPFGALLLADDQLRHAHVGVGKPPESQPGRGDRKSVVWGKSVSVRVDLGGRGIMKKKK